MKAKACKPKPPFMSVYKQRPGERGDPGAWRAAFRQRMTGEEARAEIKDEKPWDILSVPRGAPWAAIKKAYRAACLEWHPDLPQNHARLEQAEAMMKKINAAYTLLEDEYGEA
jgi:DnaJ-domain-containing protein 1